MEEPGLMFFEGGFKNGFTLRAPESIVLIWVVALVSDLTGLRLIDSLQQKALTNHITQHFFIFIFFQNFIEQKYFNSHHVVGDTVP